MPKPKHNPVDLDRPMTLEQFAEFWDMNPRVLGDHARAGTIPCHKIGPQIVRFWPREVLEATRHPQPKRTKNV